MTMPHPPMNDLRDLTRLRSLQARRRREELGNAERLCTEAERAVLERQAGIASLDAALRTLAWRTVHDNVEHLPRWAELSARERARLLDLHERDSYFLSEEQTTLAKLLDERNQAHTRLNLALSREKAASDLTSEVRTQINCRIELKADADNDDAYSAAATTRQAHP